MLTGRIRLINFGRDPSSLEAARIYEHIARERGESAGIAQIGAEAVRHAMETGTP